MGRLFKKDETAPSILGELLALDPTQLDCVDIARMNLLCAVGLQGAERLDIPFSIAKIDKWAIAGKRYTKDCWTDYDRRPAYYNHRKDEFRVAALVTFMERGVGIRYQPTAIGNFDCRDSRDDMLHGITSRKLGTCASVPVLYVALGRRLGYSMYLALAKGHVLAQWVSPDGAVRFNIEAAGRGLNTHPNEHYHHWPAPLTAEEIAGGNFLRPLRPNEELALFLGMRGNCLMDNGRLREARQAIEHAWRLWPTMPGRSHCACYLKSLEGPKWAVLSNPFVVGGSLDACHETINSPLPNRPLFAEVAGYSLIRKSN